MLGFCYLDFGPFVVTVLPLLATYGHVSLIYIEAHIPSGRKGFVVSLDKAIEFRVRIMHYSMVLLLLTHGEGHKIEF